eukprot:g7602.t1
MSAAHHLRHTASGLCLTAQDNGKTELATVHLRECAPDEGTQKWSVITNGTRIVSHKLKKFDARNDGGRVTTWSALKCLTWSVAAREEDREREVRTLANAYPVPRFLHAPPSETIVGDVEPREGRCQYQGPYRYNGDDRTWCRKACDRAAHCTHYAHGRYTDVFAPPYTFSNCLLFNSCDHPLDASSWNGWAYGTAEVYKCRRKTCATENIECNNDAHWKREKKQEWDTLQCDPHWGCDVFNCCDRVPSCASFQCDLSNGWKKNNQNDGLYCEVNPCTAGECCTALPRCGSQIVCDVLDAKAGWKDKDSRASTYCDNGTNSCTKGECCDPLPRCDTFNCHSVGMQDKADKAERFCSVTPSCDNDTESSKTRCCDTTTTTTTTLVPCVCDNCEACLLCPADSVSCATQETLCPAGKTQLCAEASCTVEDGYKYRENWPTDGEASCWPVCSQETVCRADDPPGQTWDGVAYILKAGYDGKWYEYDATESTEDQRAAIMSHPRGVAFRDWCCVKGCKQPRSADRSRFDGVDWAALMIQPGMAAGPDADGYTNSNYDCASGYTGTRHAQSQAPKFACPAPGGVRATFPGSCDKPLCDCTDGSVSSELDTCPGIGKENCGSCISGFGVRTVGDEKKCWKLCSTLSCSDSDVEETSPDGPQRWFHKRDARVKQVTLHGRQGGEDPERVIIGAGGQYTPEISLSTDPTPYKLPPNSPPPSATPVDRILTPSCPEFTSTGPYCSGVQKGNLAWSLEYILSPREGWAETAAAAACVKKVKLHGNTGNEKVKIGVGNQETESIALSTTAMYYDLPADMYVGAGEVFTIAYENDDFSHWDVFVTDQYDNKQQSEKQPFLINCGTDEEYCEERTGSCEPAWCCVSGCRVPSLAVLNENGYANHIDYPNVLSQTLLYPNAAASGYTSLATAEGLTSSPSCDDGWHGTPKFRCSGEQAELN